MSFPGHCVAGPLPRGRLCPCCPEASPTAPHLYSSVLGWDPWPCPPPSTRAPDALPGLLGCPNLPSLSLALNRKVPTWGLLQALGTTGWSHQGPEGSRCIITSHVTRSGHQGGSHQTSSRTGWGQTSGDLHPSTCALLGPAPPSRRCTARARAPSRGRGGEMTAAFAPDSETSLSVSYSAFPEQDRRKEAFGERRTPQPRGNRRCWYGALAAFSGHLGSSSSQSRGQGAQGQHLPV